MLWPARACARVRVCACARVCVCACACARVRAWGQVLYKGFVGTLGATYIQVRPARGGRESCTRRARECERELHAPGEGV